jgi:hypothetical protein
MGIEAGASIVIVGDHPDNGKVYKIGEVRQDGWILTTDNRLFHHQFFEVCPSLEPKKRGSKRERTWRKRSATLSTPRWPSSPVPSIDLPSSGETLLGDTGVLSDDPHTHSDSTELSPSKVMEVPEGLLGDTNIPITSTELSPSKVMEVPEGLLGDTGVLNDSDRIQLNSTELSPSKVMEVPEGLLGDTSVLKDNSYPKLGSTDLSPSKKETENIKRPRRAKGQGSGYLITTYANQGKYGQKYPQIFYQVEFGKRKRSIYLPPEKVEKVRELDRAGKPIGEILEAIDSPKAREVMEEYRSFLKSKLGV